MTPIENLLCWSVVMWGIAHAVNSVFPVDKAMKYAERVFIWSTVILALSWVIVAFRLIGD